MAALVSASSKRKKRGPKLPPCRHLPELSERESIFNGAYYSALHHGTMVGLKKAIVVLGHRLTEAMDKLASTPRADPRRKQMEDLVIERTAALHSVSRDDRGHLRQELAGQDLPRDA